MRQPQNNVAAGHLAMLAFSLAVAGSFILGSQVANEIAPQALTAVRFVLAVAVIGVVVLATGQGRRAHFKAPWRFMIPGACFAVYFILMFEALKTAPPVNLAIIFTLTPVLTAGFDWALNRQGVGPRVLLALAVGAIGAAIVIFDGQVTQLIAFELSHGEWMFFAGVIAHAAYPAFMARINRGEPASVASLGALMAAMILTLVSGLPQIAETDWAALRGFVWATIFYVGIFATAFSFFLVRFAITRLPGAKVMAYTYLTPFWVALGMGVFLNDWPAPITYAGAALIAVSLILLLYEGDNTLSKSPSKNI